MRQEGLRETKAIAQADFEAALSAKDSAIADFTAAEAAIEAAEAEVKKAEAAVTQASLNVEYTSVAAPISGFVTKTEVKEGNLVEFGVQLATVVNREQILINFNISDRLLLKLIANSRKASPDQGSDPQDPATSPDEALEADEDWRDLPVLVKTKGQMRLGKRLFWTMSIDKASSVTRELSRYERSFLNPIAISYPACL